MGDKTTGIESIGLNPGTPSPPPCELGQIT